MSVIHTHTHTHPHRTVSELHSGLDTPKLVSPGSRAAPCDPRPAVAVSGQIVVGGVRCTMAVRPWELAILFRMI